MPKAYFHRDYLLYGSVSVLLGGSGLCFSAGLGLFEQGALLLILLSGAGFLWVAYRYRFESDIGAAQREATGTIRIEQHCLRRYRRYPFGAASIAAQPVMAAADINEVDLGWPVQVVIHRREVIFLEDSQREDLREFALRNGIPISSRPAIWSMIADPYLDTETTPEEHENLFHRLEKQGVSRVEVEAARGKIRLNLLAATYLTWEWVGYDHSDVLRLASPLVGRERFYWYTMELALRNLPGAAAP